MDLEIDAKRICQAALADAGPGEDLDEALLRQCKAQYPDQHAEVYSALTQALDVVAERAGQPKHEAVRACGESPGEFVIQVSSTVVSSSAAEDLPADMQAKIREAVPPGQGSASFSSRGARPLLSRSVVSSLEKIVSSYRELAPSLVKRR